MEFVLDNLDFPWDWNELSWCESITMKDIRGNPQLPWNYHYISNNPNLTFDFFRSHISCNWNLMGLVSNHYNYNKKRKQQLLIKHSLIIKYSLHNWLWNGLSGSSGVGIVPKLAIRELGLDL